MAGIARRTQCFASDVRGSAPLESDVPIGPRTQPSVRVPAVGSDWLEVSLGRKQDRKRAPEALMKRRYAESLRGASACMRP